MSAVPVLERPVAAAVTVRGAGGPSAAARAAAALAAPAVGCATTVAGARSCPECVGGVRRLRAERARAAGLVVRDLRLCRCRLGGRLRHPTPAEGNLL